MNKTTMIAFALAMAQCVPAAVPKGPGAAPAAEEELDPEVAFQHQYIKNHGLAPENAEHFERNRHPDGHGEEIPFEWKDGKLRIEIPFKKLSNLTTVVDVTVAAGDENQARR